MSLHARFSTLLGAALCLATLPSFAADPAPQKIVIVKADDMKGTLIPQWKKFFDVVEQKNIKASVGIICDSLEADKDGYFAWLKSLAASGRVEFWNHGWDHKQWTENGATLQEFKGSGYDHQKQDLDKSQAATVAALGAPLHTFGAPYNAIDADTAKALAALPDFTMVFSYGTPPGYEGKLLLPMAIRGENDGTGKPNFEKFKAEYEKSGRNLTFAAIQFHPPYFTDDGVQQFAQIVDFLKAEGWTFMLPSEYEAYVKAQKAK